MGQIGRNQASLVMSRLVRRSDRSKVAEAAIHSLALAAACLVTYWLITSLLARVYSISKADDLLGSMWAVSSLGAMTE